MTHDCIRAYPVFDVPDAHRRVNAATVRLRARARGEYRLRYPRGVRLEHRERGLASCTRRVLLHAPALLALAVLRRYLVRTGDGGVPKPDERVPRGGEEMRSRSVCLHRGNWGGV